MKKNFITYTLKIAAQGLLLASFARVGASKTDLHSKRHSHSGAESCFFFFCADMHQFHSYDAPPSGLQATETFSQDCAPTLSLFARMSPGDAHVKHLFVLNPLVRERSFTWSSPSRRSPRLTALFFDDGYLTCTTQEGEFLPNPGTQSFIITVTVTTKEGWQWHA